MRRAKGEGWLFLILPLVEKRVCFYVANYDVLGTFDSIHKKYMNNVCLNN